MKMVTWNSIREGTLPTEGVQVVLLTWRQGDYMADSWSAELGCLSSGGEWVDLWGATIQEPDYWIKLPPIGGYDE
jgi:hypothetical protein